MRTLRPAAALLSALSLVGCYGQPLGDETGQSVAEIQVIPTGVGCLRVVFRAPGATADTTRSFGVTPGQPASLSLGVLAPGSYSFRASAFGVACGSVTNATVAGWVGEPVAVTVTPGLAAHIALTLRPNVATTGAVDFVQPVRALYAGRDSDTTYAVLQDGTVRAWGNNALGQVGDGTTLHRTTPRVVVGLTSPLQIAAANAYACAATSNSGLHCWGAYGRLLADDYTASSLVPNANADVEPDALAAGASHLCGRFNGRVRCWRSVETLNGGAEVDAETFATANEQGTGWGDAGLVWLSASGLLMRSDYAAPGVQSELLRQRVTAFTLFTGGYCALAVDGSVRCAGDGGRGELGTTASLYTPLNTPVLADVRDATALTAGNAHVCALRADRTVVCWGLNIAGALGAGLDSDVAWTPVEVPLTDVTQIAAGRFHTCALRADGSVWCWGLNAQGQLGDGTTVSRFRPVRVQF